MGRSNSKNGQRVINKTNLNETGQATFYNITSRRIRETIVVVEKP